MSVKRVVVGCSILFISFSGGYPVSPPAHGENLTINATINTSIASLNGVLPGDAPNVTLVTSGATASFADAKVGTGKSVSISGLSLSGSAAGNYTLTQPTATANITSAGLTVIGITAANKVYDDTTTATINTSSAALIGIIPIDTGNVTLLTAGVTGSFADANVGTGKVVTITGFALSGSAADNYALTQPTTKADILPVLEITVTNPHLVGQAFSVSVPTVPGANYTLEYRNSFADPGWTTAQTISGSGAAITLTDNIAPGSARFYRIRIH